MASTSEGSTWGAGRLPAESEKRFAEALDFSERFFMGEAEVQKALAKLVRICDEEGIPYAVIGALALGEYGHRRATVDVDVIMTDDGLERFKQAHIGRGYEERVAGTGKLLDTEHGVKVDVLSTGRFPGDGRPKPIAFPDPATTALRGEHFALLPLACFLELKLASGLTAPHRLHDLVDVFDLIRSAKLGADLADELHPWVRDKFRELWQAAQSEDPYE